jgi:hypothetical protein
VSIFPGYDYFETERPVSEVRPIQGRTDARLVVLEQEVRALQERIKLLEEDVDERGPKPAHEITPLYTYCKSCPGCDEPWMLKEQGWNAADLNTPTSLSDIMQCPNGHRYRFRIERLASRKEMLWRTEDCPLPEFDDGNGMKVNAEAGPGTALKTRPCRNS